MLILTLINNQESSQNVLETARGRIEARVDASIDRIDAYLSERTSDAQVVAALPAIINSLINQRDSTIREESLAVLSKVREAYGYAAVSILDEEGDVFLSTSTLLAGKNFANRPEVQRAMQGDTYISEIGAKPGEEEIFFHATAPVYDSDGMIIGVIDLRSTLTELNNILDFDTDRTGQGSYGLLLDEHLIRVVHPSSPEYQFVPAVPLSPGVAQSMIDTGRFGSQTEALFEQATTIPDLKTYAEQLRLGQETQIFFQGETGSTGEMSETLIKKLPNKDWYYMHRVPQASFYASVNDQTRDALMVTAIAAIISVGAMIFFARQIFGRPLGTLVEVAQAIAAGDLNRRLKFQRQDEIGELATTFDTMADALQNRITAEQEAQEEAMRLQQVESTNRQNLEKTVGEYLSFVQRVADGNLNQKIDVRQNGALGDLGNGLNGMVENLRLISSQVQEASSNIASAAAEILAATTQQASSATEQSSAISQATTSVEEVRNIAQQTAKQAGQVAKDSQGMLNIAQQGTKAVEDTISGMGQIRQRVESIAQTILSLSEQTQAIGAITTTVSELADQSNMLALNAAIEAARAGEQGKSFAVVAQQVRELAERSKGATQQVQEILNEIQRATNAAVMVTEEGTKGVEEGVKLSGQAGQVIHQITTEVESGAQSNSQMAAAAHQQTAGMEQIGQAMKSIQQATTQALSSTRQAETAARDLNSLAQSLQQAVAIYRV
jgi:methyl-accepting chemotaxis protein